MSKPSRKKSKTVEVQIMFEPNRLEQDSLHKAYRYLVAVPTRRLMTKRAASEAASQGLVPARERNLS